MKPQAARVAELRRRYLAQRRAYIELEKAMREVDPHVPSERVAAEHHKRIVDMTGQPMMTQAELSELFDALPDDPREPTRIIREPWWRRLWAWLTGWIG